MKRLCTVQLVESILFGLVVYLLGGCATTRLNNPSADGHASESIIESAQHGASHSSLNSDLFMLIVKDNELLMRDRHNHVERLAHIEPWTFQGHAGKAYISDHYRVLTTIDQPFVAMRLVVFAERSLARFEAQFPSLPKPPTGMETFVLASRPQWRAFVAKSLGPAGIRRYDAIERGGFTEQGRSVLWDIGVHDTFAILAHEGWHQLDQSVIDEPMPTWLDEGIACWAEGFRWNPVSPQMPEFLPWSNVERFDQLRRAHAQNSLLSLKELLSNRPQDLLAVSNFQTLTYYAQSWVLVQFLLADPQRKEALDRLLADYAADRVGANIRSHYGSQQARAFAMRRAGLAVWQLYFGDDLQHQSRQYEAFLAKVIMPGAKNAIVEGRSPLTTD